MTSTLQYTAPTNVRVSPMAPAGFSCAFVPHNCAHDVIFSDVYLRTNRTNHTKIMRCFPHCCPDHRKRSYCGSAIHLQLLAPKDAAPSIAPENLVVYGRFRPHNVAPFVPGQRVAVSSILSSLQCDDPSKGEWVESKLVRYDGSKGHSSWLYEVNPSGRWYYPWSGAATIAMRATEHVFEALTFRRVGSGALEFVTGTKSPNFRLMSFRRGVAGGKPPKAVDAEPSDGSEEASPKRRTFTRPPTVPVKKRALPPSPIKQPVSVYKLPSPTVHSAHQKHAPMHLLTPEFSPSLLHPSEAPHGQHAIYGVRDKLYFQPRHVEQVRATEPVSASTTLAKLLPWLQDLPASTIGSRAMLSWERIVQDACEAHVVAARTGGPRLGLVPILAALESASVASPSHGLSQPKLTPSPLDAIDAAVRVLLHIWFDVDCVRASDVSVQRFLRHGFYPDRQQFAIAHAAWVQDVEAHAERYLHSQTRVTWSHLSVITSGHQSHGHFSPPPPTQSSSDVFSCRAFVAQCRERFIHRGEAHRESNRSHKRQRTSAHSSQSTKVPLELLAAGRVWSSRMEDVSIEIDGLAPNALSLMTVIQFWKHLSCIRLDYDHATRTLSVASVFNASVTDACFTRLVLDGKHRWFNCLPAGDATTGTTLMGFVIGDYAGYATSARTIHVTTYLWPTCADALSGNQTAYAWHWTIDATSLSTNQTSVSVVVETACLQRPDLTGSFETMPITEKLRCIGRWQHVCQAQLAYQAQ